VAYAYAYSNTAHADTHAYAYSYANTAYAHAKHGRKRRDRG